MSNKGKGTSFELRAKKFPDAWKETLEILIRGKPKFVALTDDCDVTVLNNQLSTLTIRMYPIEPDFLRFPKSPFTLSLYWSNRIIKNKPTKFLKIRGRAVLVRIKHNKKIQKESGMIAFDCKFKFWVTARFVKGIPKPPLAYEMG